VKKRVRSARLSTRDLRSSESAAAVDDEREADMQVEQALHEDLARLEARVADFLRDIQKDVNTASAYMLEGMMAAFSRKGESIRCKIPDLQNLRTLNQRLEQNVDAIRNLD
jgi:hypothetical protein